ncbi:MAG: ABC transporter permease [Actinomycetales bacterium]|nr:ABC transporter permease [Actinomycetales bacterium]
MTEIIKPTEPGSTSGPVPARRQRMEQIKSPRDLWLWPREFGLYMLPVVMLLLVWEAATHVFGIQRFLLPRPGDVLSTLWEKREILLDESWVTFQESLLGFLLAVAVAVPVAVLLTFSKIAARTIYPVLVISQVIPKVAVAPLLVVWMGFGVAPKILLAFLVAFFPIVVNTATGLNNLEPKMIHLARSMGASTWQTFVYFRLPSSLPIFFAGLKVGVTFAVIGALVGEFVGAGSGLGHLTVIAMGSLNTELVFASIIVMAAIGVAMYVAIEILERLLVPWSRSRRLEQMGG